MSRPRFAASFTQHCENQRELLRGTVVYRDDDGPVRSLPVIDTAKYSHNKNSLVVRGYNLMPGASVSIDGAPVQVHAQKGQKVRVRRLRLEPGVHQVVVTNPDGGESFPYEIAVF